jgi:hypothetical protein
MAHEAEALGLADTLRHDPETLKAVAEALPSPSEAWEPFWDEGPKDSEGDYEMIFNRKKFAAALLDALLGVE